MMQDDPAKHYQSEAEKCQRLATDATCPDAREYYEALRRDYIKLAGRAKKAD